MNATIVACHRAKHAAGEPERLLAQCIIVQFSVFEPIMTAVFARPFQKRTNMAFEANWFNWRHFWLKFRWCTAHGHRYFHRFRSRLAWFVAAQTSHLLARKRKRHGTHRLDGVAVFI